MHLTVALFFYQITKVFEFEMLNKVIMASLNRLKDFNSTNSFKRSEENAL